ncbi:MAG: anthranilate phosphoribosyltransferase [Vicinamibacterales bacterium]|nr:anthranilate phosphoribosyltransferase [Vicinamibacterales bacterium]
MFSTLLDKLLKHHDLSSSEAAAAMEEIMAGRAAPAQIGGLLIGLAMKGERPDEIVGLARTMRANAVRLVSTRGEVFDTCGTGGDQSHTFNVSSVVALVLAGCDVTVAKHGNRAVSSRCGSADLFEALGVNVAAAPVQVERCLDAVGIGFFFAPTFHPSMRHAGPARKALGVRTAFNLLGPLTNPAGATRQLVGVPRPEHTELIARALALLGSERAWVVHGADGLDEISTTGHTKVSECWRGVVNTFYVHPAEHGMPRAEMRALQGGDASENAAITRSILSGATGPTRDVVVLNAAAALLVAERVRTLRDGIVLAAEAIDSGGASRKLDQLVEVSNRRMEANPA